MIESAIERINALPATHLMARSSIIETAPEGLADQPNFLNGVVELETALEPAALLDALQRIERELGRVRVVSGGPRTIDLDILMYGERRQADSKLQLPHPRMEHRRFVLEPLAELAPDRVPPGSDRTVRQLLEALNR